MAKDPAFLFYPGDWQGGTSTFSRFLKGCYMDLLVAQFNSGPLSLEEIKTVLGSDFGTSWPTLQKKFKSDKTLFFNERLETEKLKRKEYSLSRSKNKLGKKITHEPTYDNHMNGHKDNKDENRNKDLIEKGGSGERDGVVIYGIDSLLKELSPSVWLEEIEINFGLQKGDGLLFLKDFSVELKLKSKYGRALGEIKEHFYNSLKFKIEKNAKQKPANNNDRAKRAESVDNMENLALKVLESDQSPDDTGSD